MIIGVVGKANVGKSTFFKAATLAEVEIANYPFATIKPNNGIGYVKIMDPAIDFNKKSNPREGFVIDNFRFVPVNMVDVAGLVPGAHKGEGLGMQFLNDLNQADVLIHVIDCSGGTNEKGEPVAPGSYDPARDVEFLENELDHWYFDILAKAWDKLKKQLQIEKDSAKVISKQMSGLGANEDMVKQILKGFDPNPGNWNEEQLFSLASQLRRKTKPMIIACNKIDKHEALLNHERLKQKFPEYIFVPCSAESELALREAHKHGLVHYIPGERDFKILKQNITEQQKKGLDFMKHLLEKRSTGVQQVLNAAVFELLKYIAIFPGGANKLEDKDGNTLPDCFLMPPGSTALDFAFRLHTDFGKNFIKAINVRTKMPVGKEHILQHMDIVEIAAK